jgi:hypothetical protein
MLVGQITKQSALESTWLGSRIVLLEASFQVSRPAHIGSVIILASASQHVN